MIDVLNLVAEHGDQFIFGIHQLDQSCSDEDMPAGQREGIHKIRVGDVMELVRQLAVSARRHSQANASDIVRNDLRLLLLFGRQVA